MSRCQFLGEVWVSKGVSGGGVLLAVNGCGGWI